MNHKRKCCEVIICFVLSNTTVLAFSISYSVVPIDAYRPYLCESYSKLDGIVAQVRYMMQNFDLLLTILMILIFFTYIVIFLKYREPWCKSRCVLAFIYSFLSVVGKCFKDGGNFDFCLSGAGHFVLCIIFGASFYVFYYAILTGIEWLLGRRTIASKSNSYDISKSEVHSRLNTFIFVCICQIPNLYLFFPAIVNWDGLRQLDFWIGSLEWTTHHPAFSTIIMGLIFEIGRSIGGTDYFGFFLYVCIQIIVHAILVSMSVDMLKKWKVGLGIRRGIVIFYSLFSIWQMYLITYIKDTSYYLAVWWFVICVLRVLDKKEKKLLSHFVGLVISSFFVSMLRNDGVYVISPTIVILVITFKKYRKECIVSLVIVILGGCVGINIFLVDALGIGKGDIKEALSIPFQQTARYVSEYPDEVTEYEEQTIDKLLLYNELADRYDPDISDAVKGSRFESYTEQDLREYFEVWWKQFLKHPVCYIESFLNSSYRYWYIGALQYERSLCTYAQVTSTYVDRGDFEFEFIAERSNGRKMVENLHNIENELPAINLLYRPSTYIWTLFFAIYLIIKRKHFEKLIACIPTTMCFLINMASPVNGSIRYALPIMICMPMILLYSILDQKEC